MDVTKPYRFIGFGAMAVTKPYKFTGFGAMDVTVGIWCIRPRLLGGRSRQAPRGRQVDEARGVEQHRGPDNKSPSCT